MLVEVYQWTGTSWFYYEDVYTTYANPSNFSIALPPGTYTASVSGGTLPIYYGDGAWERPSGPGQPGTFVVADGGSLSRTFAYPTLSEISGVVTVGGKAKAGADVAIHRWDAANSRWDELDWYRTDWKGRYSVPALRDGTYLAVLEIRTDAGWVRRIAGTTVDIIGWTDPLHPAPAGPGVFTVAGADQIRNYEWNAPNPAPPISGCATVRPSRVPRECPTRRWLLTRLDPHHANGPSLRGRAVGVACSL